MPMSHDAPLRAFPDLRDVIARIESDYEREFVRTEYGAGLSYYLSRLDRLMFGGGRVLDAGCGAGQWSIALSQRFEHVEALDMKPARLEVLTRVAGLAKIGNIGVREGSIEALPYPERSFDAVFCYGVMMFTAMERTLGEFNRVLRPGGRVYVCLNADGWSRYLIEERGAADPQARLAGQRTLYDTFWRRAAVLGLIPSLHDKFAALGSLASAVKMLRWQGGRRRLSHFLLLHSRGGTELWEAVSRYCGPEYRDTLLDDVWETLKKPSPPVSGAGALAVKPEEFEALVRQAGFADFQWSEESGLACDWLLPSVAPKYNGTFGDELAVWECLFIKSDFSAAAAVERHLGEARRAYERRLYAPQTAAPVLSNRTRWTYPQPLLEHARLLGERLGGLRYLKRLAETVAAGSRGEEEAVCRLIRFVQDAVFRDPVSQPLTETGAVPDALTALMCARGRCGHTSAILVELCKQLGLDARLRQFPRHIIAEAKADGRWVLADADAFKNGVIPVNREGRLLTWEEVDGNPYQLDRYPATGWFIRPNSRFTQDAFGNKVAGYVDALAPDQRGYVSGYYAEKAQGFPPAVPEIVRFEVKEGHFRLEWTPVSVKEDRLLGYRVSVGTASRGWSYELPGPGETILQATPADVLSAETRETGIDGDAPADAGPLFAAVTAFSSRIDKEPDTYFWPSEEARCDR